MPPGRMRSSASMRLFIDTGSVEEVEEIGAWGVLSGATTNPSWLGALTAGVSAVSR